jgi:hypothetical protein
MVKERRQNTETEERRMKKGTRQKADGRKLPTALKNEGNGERAEQKLNT